MPVSILHSIYTGPFTSNQTSIVPVICGLILGAFVYKKVKFDDIKRMFIESWIAARSRDETRLYSGGAVTACAGGNGICPLNHLVPARSAWNDAIIGRIYHT